MSWLILGIVAYAALVLLALGLCRTAADPEPPADQCSDEEISRRLKRLFTTYDAPDPALYERLYLIPRENDR